MEDAARWRSTPPGIEQPEVIGRGGFSTVFKGWQPEFNRVVAVKVLEADARNPEVRSRFEREVRAMGTVSDHPNVVPVYDAGIHDDRPFLVMPYLAGGSLADELGRGPLDPTEVARIGRGVADALATAHDVGLLHRDVKPANILRTAYGEPKLADFGVARFADATATHGNLAMTLAYAAPEVLRGEPATHRSDVYSLGATMHALLRGAPPFAVPEDAAPMAMAVRVLTDDAPDLRAVGVPSTLATVVERAMAKDPAARQPSAAALRDELDKVAVEPAATTALAASPTATTATTPDTRPAVVSHPGPRRAPVDRRLRTLAATVALLGLALVALLVGVNLVDDGDGDTAQATTTTEPPAGPSTGAAPPDTSGEDAVGRAGVGETEVTVTVPATEERSDKAPGSPTAAARHYFSLLDDGRIDDGWAMLSPRYQQESGESSYRGFWSTIDAVEVLDAEEVAADRARVTVRYTRDDGSTTTETNTLRFVRDDGGRLLVDGSS